MTTVACDGRTMASDSQVSGDYTDRAARSKLARVAGAVIGAAGVCTDVVRFQVWYADPAQAKPRLGKSFEALVARDGKLYYYDAELTAIELKPPAAIGSGNAFAMGAFYMNATAVQAVAAARKYDPFTGGRTVSIRLRTRRT